MVTGEAIIWGIGTRPAIPPSGLIVYLSPDMRALVSPEHTWRPRSPGCSPGAAGMGWPGSSGSTSPSTTAAITRTTVWETSPRRSLCTGTRRGSIGGEAVGPTPRPTPRSKAATARTRGDGVQEVLDSANAEDHAGVPQLGPRAPVRAPPSCCIDVIPGLWRLEAPTWYGRRRTSLEQQRQPPTRLIPCPDCSSATRSREPAHPATLRPPGRRRLRRRPAGTSPARSTVAGAPSTTRPASGTSPTASTSPASPTRS